MNGNFSMLRTYHNDDIADYCNGIESIITSTESDPAIVRGARIALDAMRRMVGVAIPQRRYVMIVNPIMTETGE